MKKEIILSGIGGQGIMLIGTILCTVASEKDYNVTFIPTYGQEKRGGRTSCQIVISDSMESPIISEADVVLIMDEKSLVDFENSVKKGAHLIINSSMIEKEVERDDINVLKVPINDIADNLNSSRSANFVALGVALKYIDIVAFKDINDYMGNIFKGSVKESNEEALKAGYDYI